MKLYRMSTYPLHRFTDFEHFATFAFYSLTLHAHRAFADTFENRLHVS